MIYVIAINGTTISDTFAILFMPPMITSAAQSVTSTPPITVAQVKLFSPIENAMWLAFGSKKLFTALVIPLICVIVHIPSRPARTPKTANNFASHFHFAPIPFSM